MEYIVGILAILKAGGAYLPLEPANPSRRLEFILQDSAARLLLTRQESLRGISVPNLKVVLSDQEKIAIDHGPCDNPPVLSLPENLAYVIYTSGSTGKPKGVMIEHTSVCNLAAAQIDLFQVRENSRILQFASFGFDASVSEIFTALLAGACLFVAGGNRAEIGANLKEYVGIYELTIATLPPIVLESIRADEIRALATIVSAGSPCLPAVADRLSRDRNMINAYGPTESAVCATAYKIEHATGRSIPIGRPIENVQTIILDSQFNLLPANITGELYLGGAGLARGYLHRPDLTAESFRPNPFTSQEGGRLYRTGDLARYTWDDQLDFSGRVDHQIKLRGYRVELEEIDAAIISLRGVAEGATLIREDLRSQQTLIAFLVASQGMSLSDVEVKKGLQALLPDYMIPQLFIWIDEIPRNSNGKVDRQALLKMDLASVMPAQSYEAPRTPVEIELVKIWQDLLGIERIGVHDHFFDLGGHSLLAVQMISRVREAFQVELPLLTLFNSAPTILGVASVIEQYIIDQTDQNLLEQILQGINQLSEEEIRALLEQEVAAAGAI
jgi:amino acid adenylation domain-containing protein